MLCAVSFGFALFIHMAYGLYRHVSKLAEHSTACITSLCVQAKEYVHRVGRTARAGRGGLAITFVTPPDVAKVQEIEHVIGHQLMEYEVCVCTIVHAHLYPAVLHVGVLCCCLHQLLSISAIIHFLSIYAIIMPSYPFLATFDTFVASGLFSVAGFLVFND